MHNILGIVVTNHACRVAIQRPFDLQSELLKSPGVAAPRAIEGGFGRSAVVRPHQRSFAWLELLL